MREFGEPLGKINPGAPSALARFGFLVGSWRFQAKVRLADGQSLSFQGTWIGRYILDGFAIADEYRMSDASGTLLVLGMNLRAYDEGRQVWNIKWLNAMTGHWTDLSPSELGGVTYDGDSIIYAFKDSSPMDADHVYTRVTYTCDSDTHFTWTGEKSREGKAWSEFMLVDCRRLEN